MNVLLQKKYILHIFLLFCIIAFTQCAGSIDSQLKKIADEANKECPKMLDQWTRLDSCAAYPGKNYIYFHTLVNEGMILDTVKFKEQFKPVIISIVKTNPNMSFFRENDVTLHYQYNDEANKFRTTIVLTPDDYKK